jgi:hypothetical protein
MRIVQDRLVGAIKIFPMNTEAHISLALLQIDTLHEDLTGLLLVSLHQYGLDVI